MDTKKKNILLGVLIVGVVAMTVAFAALATNLRINGSANVAATSWNIRFENWQKVDLTTGTTGHTNTASSPAANQLSTSDSTNVTKVEGVNVTLNQPGDVAKYTFEIRNRGSIDAKLSNVSVTDTSSNSLVGYEVKCYESNTYTGTEVTTNSVLTANGGVAYCYLQVEYKDQTNSQTPGTTQTYTQSAVSTSVSATWTWIQADGSAAAPTPTWNNYIVPGSVTNATLPTGANYWLQEDTTLGVRQVCGVLNGTTVCLSSREEEPTTCESGNTNCSVKPGSYAAEKYAEMSAINGVNCSVSVGITCDDGTYKCVIGNLGQVVCGTVSYSGAEAGNCNIFEDNSDAFCSSFN